MRACFLLLPLPLTAACAAIGAPTSDPTPGMSTPTVQSASFRGLPIDANWKERLEQPYVFLEKRGDYGEIGPSMERLLVEVQALGLRGDGPPFALFLDDPGRVPAGELRSRVCFPVEQRPARIGMLRYEVLPQAMVVYTRVSGTHLEVTQAYPALFSYLRDLGWMPGGPVREIYLAGPEATGPGELVTEIQIPWMVRPE